MAFQLSLVDLLFSIAIVLSILVQLQPLFLLQRSNVLRDLLMALEDGGSQHFLHSWHFNHGKT